MAQLAQNHDDLAAALFAILGESIPHMHSLEEEASKLKDEIHDHEKILLKVIELCGDPQTPKQLYLVTKAYSWLGKKYDEQIIHYAGAYLQTEGWKEFHNREVVEDGIKIDHAAARRASVLIDLAKAQEGMDRLKAALSNFMEAYRLEPYSAMNAVKAADVLGKLEGREEALTYLIQQKKNQYYYPTQYIDSTGTLRHNDVFKRLLDAHILKLQEKAKTGW